MPRIFSAIISALYIIGYLIPVATPTPVIDAIMIGLAAFNALIALMPKDA